MNDIKYRVYFYRNGETEPFFSTICWNKLGVKGAEGYIKDLFHLNDNIKVKAVECTE